MKIWIELNEQKIEATRPFEGSDFVEAKTDCPHCKASAPIKVQGGESFHDHDTYTCAAFCVGCKGSLGKMKVQVDTIFGIEEDNRVLNGRWRVYG